MKETREREEKEEEKRKEREKREEEKQKQEEEREAEKAVEREELKKWGDEIRWDFKEKRIDAAGLKAAVVELR